MPKVVIIEETERRHASSDIKGLQSNGILSSLFYSFKEVFSELRSTDDSTIPTVDVPQCLNLLK